jgi:hypothetical protein
MSWIHFLEDLLNYISTFSVRPVNDGLKMLGLPSRSEKIKLEDFACLYDNTS